MVSSYFFPKIRFVHFVLLKSVSLTFPLYRNFLLQRLCGSLCNCRFSKICNYARKYWNTYLCVYHLFDMQKPFTASLTNCYASVPYLLSQSRDVNPHVPSGRICHIFLYEQAKRAYLDRLKVKKIFMLKFLIRLL